MRPGTVRAARLEAGLTLAEVAGSQVTRAAIHLVETGRARPSTRTLKLIASRTGKPLSYFVWEEAAPRPRTDRVPAELRELEELVAARRFADAETTWRQLLRRAVMHPRHMGRALLRIGQVHLETGDAIRAADELETARGLLATGQPGLLAECVDSLGLALHRLEKTEALATLQDALRLCRSAATVPPQLESTILGHLGAVHVCRHDWPAAIDHYEKALDAAGNLRDLALLERMHNGLGVARQLSGDLTGALHQYHQALALAEVSHEPRIIARLENNIGSVLVELGELEAAEEHLHRSLAVCEETGLEVGRGHVLCSLVELFVARRDYSRADAHVRETLALTRRIGEKLTEAHAHQLAGQIEELLGDATRADRSFQRALDILRVEGATNRLIECEAAYAEILQARGDTTGALTHTREALMAAKPALRVTRHVASPSASASGIRTGADGRTAAR